MVRVLGPHAARAGLYSVLVVLVCPALLWWGVVDLPDEYLEFNCASLAFQARELAAGRWAQWNPYVLGGMPVAADPTSIGGWYPAALLLPLIPLDLFVLVGWILHLGLGAAGVHRLAESAGAGRTGARAAGVLWLTGTSVVTALVDGQLDMVALLAWLPWALVCLHAALDAAEPRALLRAGALAAGALGLVGLGTHARFAAIAFVAWGLYAALAWLLAEPGRRPRAGRWTALCLGALAGGTLLASPELVPAVMEVQASRSAAPTGGPWVGQALPWAGVTGLVFPRAFVIDQRWYHLGAAALLIPLSLPGNRRAWALLGTGALLFAAGMGLPGPIGLFLKPVIWALYPVETGAAAVGLLFLVVAAGLGVDRVAAAAPSARTTAALVIVGAAAVALGMRADLGLYFSSLEAPARQATRSAVHGGVAVVALGVLSGLRPRLSARTAGGLLLALVLVDGLAYAWRVEAAIPSPRVAPSTHLATPPAMDDAPPALPPIRVVQLPLRPVRELQGRSLDDLWSHPGHGWGHDPSTDPTSAIPAEAAALLRGPLRRNAGGASGVAQVGGRAKVPPMPWSVLTQGLAPARPGAGPELARPPAALARALELLGVTRVLSTTDDWPLPPSRPLPARTEAPHRVDLEDPRPPAVLSSTLVVEEDPRVALDALLRGDGDLRAQVVVSAPVSLASRPGPAVIGTVEAWAPGRWDVVLPEHGGGVLSVQERFHPGWTARGADGAPLEVVRANLVQVGVVVPPSTRRVELRYRAPGALAGMWMGLLGLGLLGFALLRGRS